MSRQSVARAHQKIQELAWEPKYHEPVSQYGTDYTFHKAAKKDPLRPTRVLTFVSRSRTNIS